MNFSKSDDRGIKFFAYNKNNMGRNDLGFSFLQDFQNFGKNGSIKAGQPSLNLISSSVDFQESINILKSNLKNICEEDGSTLNIESISALSNLKANSLNKFIDLSQLGFGYFNGDILPAQDMYKLKKAELSL